MGVPTQVGIRGSDDMSQGTWMVRAEGGSLVEPFERGGVVAVGWERIGDLGKVASREVLWERYEAAYPDDSPGKAANSVGVLFKFRCALQVGQRVVTYDPPARRYLIGEITSDYAFDPGRVGAEWPHIRRVRWLGTVARDNLSPSARNSLGSTLTLFAIDSDVDAELSAALHGEIAAPTVTHEAQLALKADEQAKSFELVKDSILALSDQAMEQLTAAVLRAMGYRTHVTARGPDRNVDVLASPDGLGLQEPRIKVEVKHRASTIGAPGVRSFLGALRQGDRGLYVSTGGFTKEAHYEAERSAIPVKLVALDELAELVIGHYEKFDAEGRTILPLVRIYMPA